MKLDERMYRQILWVFLVFTAVFTKVAKAAVPSEALRQPISATSPADPASLFEEALTEYRSGLYSVSLRKFLLFVSRNPDGTRTEDALHYVWEISHKIAVNQERLEAERARWPDHVLAAQAAIRQRHRSAETMLRQLEQLSRSLSAGASLTPLRDVPLDRTLLTTSDLDERSRLRAERYLTSIRETLKNISDQPAGSAADLHEARGYLWLYQGDLEMTVKEWKEAAALKPMDASIQGRLEWAEGTWKSEKSAEDARHELLLGVSDFRQGQYQKALPHLEKAASTDPTNAEVSHYLDLARKSIQEASRQQRIEELMSRGQQAYQSGRLLDAVQSWIDILAIEPNHPEARSFLERTRKRLSFTPAKEPAPQPQPSPVAKEPAALRTVSTEKAEEYYSLGLICYTDGDLQGAKNAFEQALRWDPGLHRAEASLHQVLIEIQGASRSGN